MPKLTNKATGEPVADMPYTDKGMQQAEQVAKTNPNIEIDYSPGGSYDAGGRVQRKEFALGGAVGQAAGGSAASTAKAPSSAGHCPKSEKTTDKDYSKPDNTASVPSQGVSAGEAAPQKSSYKHGGKVGKKWMGGLIRNKPKFPETTT